MTNHKLALVTSSYFLVQSYVDPYQFSHAIRLYNIAQSAKIIEDLHVHQPCGSATYVDKWKNDIAATRMTEDDFNPASLDARKSMAGIVLLEASI